MRFIAIKLIEFYQKYISRYILVGAHCRFTPTCSEYALQAFKKYNFFKALFLSFKRILRCNPYCEGGYDPLP